MILASSMLFVILKGCTKICPSGKDFDVSQSQYKLWKPLEIEVCDVNKTEACVLVSVTVKVMLCERPSNNYRFKEKAKRHCQ